MKKIRPRITKEEYDLILDYRGIQKASESAELDIKDVKHGWLKTQSASLFFTNPEYEKDSFDPDSIDWKYILKDIQLNKLKTQQKDKKEGIFDRLVYSDTHIAMNPNQDGFSQYGGKWDEEELFGRLKDIVSHILENQSSNLLIVDDLGDLMDGYDAKTVRREHDLPQNMDNQKAFDVALRFKYQLFLQLSPYYEKIIFNNICRSNHSSSFDYIVNSAFKSMVELTNSNSEVNNHRKFMNHYRVKNNIFIITHGKDDVNMKTGFKPKLDKANMEKIDNYIDHNYLLQKDCRIEFSKGDSHQMLFDWSSSDRFDYFNYLALSPSSSWVQTNFKTGVSGISFFNYKNTFLYDLKPLFFKWKN